MSKIRKLGKEGVKLVFLGVPGVYRENGEEREQYPFEGETILPLPENTPGSEEEFCKNLIAILPKAIHLNKENIYVERVILEDGRRAVHLLNPENEKTVTELEINVPEEEGYFLNAVSLEALPQLVIEKGIIKISELKTHLTLLFKGK